MSTQLSLQSILTNNRLIGPNYPHWLRNLKTILRAKRIEYVLEKDLPPPQSNAPQAQQDAYKKHQEDMTTAQVLMLASMSNELQRQYENMNVREILANLQDYFYAYSRIQRYQTSKELFNCKMSEGSSVNAHVLYMIGLIEKLSQLGIELNHELSVDLILYSLPDSFSQFILNFIMNKISVTLPELANMLATVEANLKDEGRGQMLFTESSSKASEKTRSNKKTKKVKTIKPTGGTQKGKGKKKMVDQSQDICNHCGNKGHWKRNCKIYLGQVQNKKGSPSGTKN